MLELCSSSYQHRKMIFVRDKWRRLALTGMVCASSMSTPAQAQAPLFVPEIGVMSATGNVATRPKDAGAAWSVIKPPAQGATPAPASAIQHLQPGSTLATGAGSHAVVILQAAGRALLGPETQVRLPTEGEGKGSLELLKGKLFLEISPAEVKKRVEKPFRLKTPAALLAVKGTRFFAVVEGAEENVGVHHGAVSAQTGEQGAPTDLTAGNGITLAGGRMGPARALTAEEAAHARYYGLMLQTAGNTLNMRFVPVPGTQVLFCIHETRRQDYAVYAATARGVSDFWEKQTSSPKVAQDPQATSRPDEHPVQAVSWEEAKKFCEWLSQTEGRAYRLPTDREWSLAAGLGDLEKGGAAASPESLDGKIKNVFPWEGGWPPKPRSGNYRDKAYRGFNPYDTDFLGVDDGWPETAPVMSYLPNKLGLHDLGGNVSEWCEDLYAPGKPERVLRGGCWLDFEREALLSAKRYPFLPTTQKRTCFGFRVVVDLAAP